jgi:hypothetical protein
MKRSRKGKLILFCFGPKCGHVPKPRRKAPQRDH